MFKQSEETHAITGEEGGVTCNHLSSVLFGIWNGSHAGSCGKEEISDELRMMGNHSLIREESEKIVKLFVPFITGHEVQLKDFKQGMAHLIFLTHIYFHSNINIG